jgi:hypothetical protein
MVLEIRLIENLLGLERPPDIRLSLYLSLAHLQVDLPGAFFMHR